MYILLENLQFIEIVHFLTLSWKYFHVIFLICSMSVDTFCPLRLPFLFIRPSGATSKGGRFLAGICSLPTLGGVANSHTWPQPHIMLGPSAVMPQSPLEWISLHGVGVNSACRCRTVAARLETRQLLGNEERPPGDAIQMAQSGLKDYKRFIWSMGLRIHSAPIAPALRFCSLLVSPEPMIFACYFMQKEWRSLVGYSP